MTSTTVNELANSMTDAVSEYGPDYAWELLMDSGMYEENLTELECTDSSDVIVRDGDHLYLLVGLSMGWGVQYLRAV